MRKHYLDNIRWITVVLVVIYHVFYMYNAEGVAGVVGKITDLDKQYYDVFQYIVFPWFMMILFIVSGISSKLYLDGHTTKEFVRSRTRKLLVPSTLGVVFFFFIQGWYNTAFSNVFQKAGDIPFIAKVFIILASGIGVMWYIQILWFFSMVLLLIRKIEKDRLWNVCSKINAIGIVLLSAAVFGAAQIGNTPVICVYRFGLYGFSFLLGYYVFSHDEVIDILKRYCIPLLAIAIVLGTIFSIKYFGLNYADAPVNRTPLFVFFAWSTCLAILGLAAKYADFATPFTKWMSARSFGLYLFHYLGISIIAYHMGMTHRYPALIVYTLTLISAFVTAYVLYFIISHIPFYRWVVLGISQKEINRKKEAANV